jgi:hypothetical protein
MKSMARVSLLAALAMIPVGVGTSLGQHARQPVVPVDRGGSPPPPLPDPTGIYEGTVRLTIDNGTPVTQAWRVVLKTRSCPDCASGQYWLTGTSFDGVTYPGGVEERGSVDAVIDADGSALDFRLTTINCVFVNTAIVAPPQTVLRGGSFGTQPGPTLTVRDGVIDGTVSGTDCLGRRIVGSVSLTRTTQNPGSSCGVSPGWYQLTLDDSRGRSVLGPVYVSASNCYLAARVASVELNFQIVLTTPSAGTLDLSGIDSCDMQGSGTVTRKPNGGMTATYTGSLFTGCEVNAGPVSGDFTLDPL